MICSDVESLLWLSALVEFLAFETLLQVEVIDVTERHEVAITTENKHLVVIYNGTMSITSTRFLPEDIFAGGVINDLLVHHLSTLLLIAN
jgi:hypothetical protein